MKKIFAVLLVASLILTGCGNGESESEKKDYTNATTLADLKGIKMACQAGSIHAEVALQIEGVEITTFPESNDTIVALKSGAYEGAMADEPQALTWCGNDDSLTYVPLKNNAGGFEVEAEVSGVAIGVQEGSSLRDEFNSVLSTITVEQTDALMEECVKVSLGESINDFTLKADKPANPKKTIKIAMEACSAPFNWTDTDEASFGAEALCGEGQEGLYCNGFDVQLAKYICYTLGYDVEFYAIEWDSLIPAVKTGVVDAIVSSMSPTAKREEEIDFTNVYYDINLVVVVNK